MGDFYITFYHFIIKHIISFFFVISFYTRIKMSFYTKIKNFKRAVRHHYPTVKTATPPPPPKLPL